MSELSPEAEAKDMELAPTKSSSSTLTLWVTSRLRMGYGLSTLSTRQSWTVGEPMPMASSNPMVWSYSLSGMGDFVTIYAKFHVKVYRMGRAGIFAGEAVGTEQDLSLAEGTGRGNAGDQREGI